MCDRPNGGSVSITSVSTQQVIAAGGTYQIKQRPNRVRLIISLSTAGTVEVYREVVQAGNIIASVSNPSVPYIMDFLHYGIMVPNDMWVRNPTGGNLTVNISEWLQGF